MYRTYLHVVPLKKFPNNLLGTLSGFSLYNPQVDSERDLNAIIYKFHICAVFSSVHKTLSKLSFVFNCRKQAQTINFSLSLFELNFQCKLQL